MADRKRILVIGSANMDLSMNMYKLPQAGETIVDDGGVAYTPGGKGANAAIALKKLGADSVFCTKLGADAHGQRLFNYYKEMGLNTSYIKVAHGYQTGFAAILKEPLGQNRIIYYPGANLNITGENMLDAFESAPDALYLGFEISYESALLAAKIAESRNIPIFVDAAPADKNYSLEELSPVEIFSPNETETLEYTGVLPTTMDTCLRAALSLWKRVKCKYLVIKMGARGAFVYDGVRYQTVGAYRPEKVVDTTAAGDAFTAALTLEYLRTGDIIASAKYAAAAGALTVSREGSSSSVPTEQEVADFIRRHPYM